MSKVDPAPAVSAAIEAAASALRADLAARGVPADEMGEAVVLALAVIRDQHDRAYATWLSVERRVRELERRLDDALSLDVADGIVLGPSRFSDPADMAAIEREGRVLEERVRLEQLIRSRADATPPEAPRFRHDCESCVFLGRSEDGTRDLYWCGDTGWLGARSSDDGFFFASPELIRRRGDSLRFTWVAEAHRRAVARGLVDGEGEGG